jgi:drug/metabolite transporter (DMT)-like permease
VLPAILAAVFFALSAVVSQRSARIFGPVPANCYRMCIACAALGLITMAVDASNGVSSLHGELFPRYFVSGLVGFGIGDVALFLAYARLGSRLTILINWCAASLCAPLGDLWMRGHELPLLQGLGVTAIMCGLVVALWPAGESKRRHPVSGILFAILAGVGMGMGTVMSTHANDVAHSMGFEVHGISQAFQRVTGGVIVAVAALLFVKKYLPPRREEDLKRKWKHKPFWLISTALIGPVLGVSCYQWAQLELGSSAVVVAIAATSTLLVIPLARIMEKDTPGLRQSIGTLLAVAGVVVIKLYS